MKKCSLCGGRLDSSKRCTFCGLDNTKNDDQYKHMINRNSCEEAPLTHVHTENEERSVQRSKSVQGQKKTAYKGATYNAGKQMKKMQKTSKKRGIGCGSIISVIVIIFGLIGSVFGVIEEVFNENFSDSYVYVDEDTEYNPYEYVQYELSEEGEEYSEVLEPGLYIVGLHIPEGRYEVEWLAGTYGSITINDPENSIYWGDLMEEDVVYADVRLYNGACFEVSTGVVVNMYSSNAQPLVYEWIDNPLEEEVLVEDMMVAGEDFPAGVYDISGRPAEEYGTVTCDIYLDNGDISFYLFGDDMSDTQVYYNMTFTEGSMILLEDMEEVLLIPSEKIAFENYEDFYEMFY